MEIDNLMDAMQQIKNFLQVCGASLLSIISIVIAAISLIKSSKAQRLQSKVNELDLKIKQYELEKVEREVKAPACVEGRVMCMGIGKYRLKIWNSGKSTAYNVSAKFKDDVQIKLYAQGKMPYEELEPNKSFEVILIVHQGSARKFTITTNWYDSEGTMHSKDQMGDI